METDNGAPQHPAQRPSQPGMPHRLQRPIARRPMVDGFAPRRAGAPNLSPVKPVQPQRLATPITVSGPLDSSAPASSPQPQRPAVFPQATASEFTAQPAAQPTAAQPQPAAPQQAEDFMPRALDTTDAALPPSSESRLPKEPNATGHSGLVGLVVFVVLGALLLAPLLPGKIMQSFPLTSDGFSTGDQSLDCLGTQGPVHSQTTYNTKLGAPIVYSYSTTTTESATCSGKAQSATTGHTSQFSPLALVADAAVALVVAIVVARAWRMLFGERRSKR